MTSPTFTEHLLGLDEPTYRRAIAGPFLQAAGRGLIPRGVLSRWLSQDRLYAQTYVRFASQLLSKVRLPTVRDPAATPPPLADRLTDCLLGCLTNIRTELRFFDDTAAQFGLDLNQPWDDSAPFGPNPITRAYADFFLSTTSQSASLLQGMVALWATEKCYLNAWKFAKESSVKSGGSSTAVEADQDGGALRTSFIPNWTSDGFGAFVDEIENLLNELAKDIGDEERAACEEVWRHVLWLEERFWPVV